MSAPTRSPSPTLPVVEIPTHSRLVTLLRWSVSIAAADRRNRLRLLVMAFGIALCALALLGVATINPMINSITARNEASQPTTNNAGPTFRTIGVINTIDGQSLIGTLLAGPAGSTPPPGTNRFPADGELLVSPGLAQALADPSQTTLRALISGSVTGEIDPSVLNGPGDWVYYRGVSTLSESAQQATGWGPVAGTARQPVTSLEDLDPQLWQLLITGVVILLVPLLLFTALAGRIGAARRDRRSALLRLLGASATQLRFVVLAEAALASVAGVALAALAYLGIRSLTDVVTIGGRGVQPSDVRPDATAAVVIALLVPVLASLAALSGARQARVSPLGPMLRGRRRPHLGWRIALLTVTVACSIYVIRTFGRFGTPDARWICVLLVLDILCVAALVGPLTDALVRLCPGGGPVYQLTRGRLLDDPAQATRSAAALATVVASLLGLMSLLAARGEITEQDYGPPAPDGSAAHSGMAADLSVADFRRLETSLLAVPGVEGVNMSAGLPMTAPNADATLATCDQIVATTASTCRDGDVIGFLSIDPSELISFTLQDGSGVWTPPATARDVRLGPEYGGANSFLLTPAALAQQLPQITTLSFTTVSVWMPATSYPDALAATAWLGWQRDTILTYEPYHGTDFYGLIRLALLIGAAVVLLICALAQWLLAAEYVNDRRRTFAVARASGVPTAVLERSVVLSALLPVGVGTVVATGVGAWLAWEIKFLRGGDPVSLDWRWLAVSVGITAVVTLLIGVGSALSVNMS